MKFLSRGVPRPVNGSEFDPATEIGERMGDIERSLEATINMHTRLAHLREGLRAAEHKVLFGTTGFSQWSEETKVKEAIEERLSLSSSKGLRVEDMSECPINLYTPSLMAAAILYGRRPTGIDLDNVRGQLYQASRRRIRHAYKQDSGTTNRSFNWAYATQQLAEVRIIAGEDDFATVINIGATAIGYSAEGLSTLLSDRTRENIGDLIHGDLRSPKGVTTNLAALRIIEASSVEIIEGVGLTINDPAPEVPILSAPAGSTS